MPRLNNKDFTVEELERMIFLLNGILHGPINETDGQIIAEVPGERVEELKQILKGTTLGEAPVEPLPILWNVHYQFSFIPTSFAQAEMIKNAMRSAEVNENLKRRHSAMVYEEMNWYQDRIKVFMTKGETTVLE